MICRTKTCALATCVSCLPLFWLRSAKRGLQFSPSVIKSNWIEAIAKSEPAASFLMHARAGHTNLQQDMLFQRFEFAAGTFLVIDQGMHCPSKQLSPVIFPSLGLDC